MPNARIDPGTAACKADTLSTELPRQVSCFHIVTIPGDLTYFDQFIKIYIDLDCDTYVTSLSHSLFNISTVGVPTRDKILDSWFITSVIKGH